MWHTLRPLRDGAPGTPLPLSPSPVSCWDRASRVLCLPTEARHRPSSALIFVCSGLPPGVLPCLAGPRAQNHPARVYEGKFPPNIPV